MSDKSIGQLNYNMDKTLDPYKKILFLPLLVSNALIAQERPNILWVTIEDTSPQFIGCYGNKDARTPVIDQLAKEGVRFTNAFSTGSVCSII